MPPLDPAQWFNLEHWFDGNPGPPSAWYWLFLVFYVLVAVAGMVLYWYIRPRQYAGHTLHNRMAEVAGIASVSWAVWGMLLLGVRALGIGLLSARLLTLLTMLGGVGLAGYAAYFYYKLYPPRLETYRREEERKRFMPKPKAARPGGASRPKPRGKR
jgi:hypothetical protein